jgi:signal transduction histidine kinase
MIETALENARLQSLIAARIAQVEESRRRLIVVVDTERSALASRIDNTVASTLDQAASLIRTLDNPDDLIDRVDQARRMLTDFSRGVHPRQLADQGLAAAIGDLARTGPTPTDVDVWVGRLPSEIESVAYFVVAEAMTNITKHADASHAHVSIRAEDWQVRAGAPRSDQSNAIGGTARKQPSPGEWGLRSRVACIALTRRG